MISSMLSPDYKRAQATAKRVLREQSIVRPPILPREVAQSYGLEVNVVEFAAKANDVAGFIDFTEQTIYVNAADPYNRQTFTIAHELGHNFLHKDYYKQHPEAYRVLLRRPVGRQNNPLEKEANAFAAELLVPKEWLQMYSKYANEKQLAELFSVSTEVIGYRLGRNQPFSE